MAAMPAVRCLRVRVRGQVQGVGFRPFVYRLAGEQGLQGWVRNDAAGVEIRVQGNNEALERFLDGLDNPPTLARIDHLEVCEEERTALAPGFVIATSGAGMVSTGITPDAAVCPDCLDELFDPRNPRYRYPFINCTHCGPRYTITFALPYDRPQTSMADFVLCPDCAREYGDPLDRRFHAQPVACPACGPELSLLDGNGREVICSDPLTETLARIRAGEIVAVKGLGGFHLICDAGRAETVARLRARKHRPHKPFAVMVANPASLVGLAHCHGGERQLLENPQRPVVLLEKQLGCDQRLAGIAPQVARLGVMLPYTPLHYLLFHEAAGRPRGSHWLDQPQPLVLLCTSANPGGEPLVIDNDEAVIRLKGIADALLVHDRQILVRVDDSVALWNGRAPAFIRRARGHTPRRIRLPRCGPSVLAVGGHLKNTVCLTREDEAFLSQHIGDLDNRATCNALEEAVEHLMRVLEITPVRVARDLHPDFHSSQFADDFAARRYLPCLPVQHHHAHIAAVAAEHRLTGPLLGLALDGLGLGDDGTLWGGELLEVDDGHYRRVGRLSPLPLPGGDRAAREPWRMAAAALHRLGRGGEIPRRFPGEAGSLVGQMLERGFNTPETSSAGRLFDAAAGLLGIVQSCSYEGQAAMILEGLAAGFGPVRPLSGGCRITREGELDCLPLLDDLSREDDPARGAARFHATLAEGLADWAIGAARLRGLQRVALGGGCLLNLVLSQTLEDHLTGAGLTVYRAEQVPASDGGLSLGQAWAALGMAVG